MKTRETLFFQPRPRHRMRFPEHPTYPPRRHVITQVFHESEPIRVSARCFLLPIAEPFSPWPRDRWKSGPSIKIPRYACSRRRNGNGWYPKKRVISPPRIYRDYFQSLTGCNIFLDEPVDTRFVRVASDGLTHRHANKIFAKGGKFEGAANFSRQKIFIQLK